MMTMTPEFCQLVGMVANYLDKHKDGADRLRSFLNDDDYNLLSTEDVTAMTGWSSDHVLRLCKQGLLPHIPGRPHKFLKAPLREQLYQMQIGGIFGRQKTRKRRIAK